MFNMQKYNTAYGYIICDANISHIPFVPMPQILHSAKFSMQKLTIAKEHVMS